MNANECDDFDNCDEDNLFKVVDDGQGDADLDAKATVFSWFSWRIFTEHELFFGKHISTGSQALIGSKFNLSIKFPALFLNSWLALCLLSGEMR